MIKRMLLISVIVLLVSGYLFGQAVISEVGYYKVESKAFGDTEDNALDNAVDTAVDRIFDSLHKDTLFKEMFLSAWPEAVILDSHNSIQIDERFEVSVTVKIDRNAIILAEPNYRNAVQARLNESELLIVEIEALLQNAGIAEENQEMKKASVLYSQSENSLEELKAVIGDISDMSVMSSEGNSTEYFQSRISGFDTIIQGGLSRLQIVKQEEADKTQTEELLSTYRPLKSLLNRLEREHNKLNEESPFYGFTEEQLQDVITRSNAALSTIENELQPKYAKLNTSIPNEMESLKSRIELDIDRIGVLKQHFTNMSNNAEKEMAVPIAEREEEKQKKTELTNNLKEKAKWVLLHPPRDRLVLRITPDKSFIEGNWEKTGYDISLTAEKAFDAGVWGRASLKNEWRPGYERDYTTPYSNNSSGLCMDKIVSSQLALGFWSDTLYGIGLEWQWDNRFVDYGEEVFGSEPQESKYYFSAFWGKVDKERNWPTFLAEYKYGIPNNFDTTDFAILFNGDLKLIMRGDDFLLFEAEIWSLPKNRNSLKKDGVIIESLDYLCIEQGLALSAAIRAPGPFTWGVTFTGTRYGNYENRTFDGFSDMIWGWGGFFQYSF